MTKYWILYWCQEPWGEMEMCFSTKKKALAAILRIPQWAPFLLEKSWDPNYMIVISAEDIKKARKK